MSVFFTNIISSPWLGTAIAVLGIIVAVILYRAAEIGARPVYQRRSLQLIGFNQAELPQEVEILYRGEKVERLTKSDVIFWNSGKQIVRGSDIVADDLVRCEFSTAALALEVRIVQRTRDANKFTATIDKACPNRVVISFDYLDPHDGAVVEILHTDSLRDPAIKGTIRGVPKGIFDWGSTFEWDYILRRRRNKKLTMFVRIFPIAAMFFGALLIVASFTVPDTFLAASDTAVSPSKYIEIRALSGFLGFVYLLPGAVFLWMSRRRYPKSLRET